MKKILGLVTTIIISVATYAQTGPKIEFKSVAIDYGTVYKGEDDGIRVFEFTNTGDAPLIVKNVKSSCGCTVPTKPKKPIAPGESDKIEVKYNMRPGPIRKTITVMTNAVNYENGTVALKIKGLVKSPGDVNILEKKKTLPNQ
ncbi:MAG: hypothetical protein BM557_06020 [Flavobacterium sp. MedPE-SWcel]|uniref:DUF1573 domain-containing protein n=1 Tax=uncultured Flavobacterium sp. TaxID=165435 RepID=UPI00091722A9|nr:DUF1573 domain-containing protein [uncultured Flavobacterium sp.]OIQ20222.1 MAG: hypothetical protein BM557_06020 [Flavobacterium sp. MedPE-SWcel]